MEGRSEMRIISLALAALVLTGCAQEAVRKQTQSGYPEGMFKTASTAEVRSKIINGCINKGLQIEDSGAGQIVCSRELDGLQASFTQIAISNSYSTTPQMKVKFVPVQVGDDVRVVAYPWVESVMPGGQVRKVEANGNKDRNAIQGFLNSLGAS
jgi:PBP1b-binding outer membrane lipoprotein LpoB